MRIGLLIVLCAMIFPTGVLAEEPSVNLRKTVIVDVVKKTQGAVVNISTTKMVTRRVSPFGNDPFFGQFDTGHVVRVPANSLGSGFIVHPDGFVVTNHHVIDRARTIVVELSDGRKLNAELISSEPQHDLAILKINSDKPLPTLELGDSADLMIGEPVIAVGNPLGFSHSVSTGIVSASHRDLKSQDDKVILADLIQTDAAINPGNSGGPLLNAYGQVIGINTAIRGDAQNIGFAIPVGKLRDHIPQLMKSGMTNRVTLNIELYEKRSTTPPADVTSSVYAKNESSPIATINGQAPRNIVDAQAILLRVKVNETVLFKLADGKEIKLTAQALPKPDVVVAAKRKLGIGVEPVTPALSQKLGLQTEDGMLVTEVANRSISSRAGLQPGDVIVRIERYPCSNFEQFGALINALPDEGRIPITIVRGDQIGQLILDF